MTVIERVAYIRGLAEGLNLNSEKAETKMFNAIMDVLEDLADETADIEDTIAVMTEQLDEVDADLSDLETIIYDDLDDVLDDEDYEDAFMDMDDEEEEYYEVECPACHDTICVDEGILEEGSIDCPNCGEKLEFEIEFDDEDAPQE
ncbi:MAG: hypothetical protein PUD72_02610 [Oscillospiraceae bacterium]|nr:hypothetical protein [Oscillospiraceae bacterium]